MGAGTEEKKHEDKHQQNKNYVNKEELKTHKHSS